MTKEEARIVLLEQAVMQAQNTIEFLVGCITEPGMYRYGYPKQTEQFLEELGKLVPRPKMCPHSGFKEGCEGCENTKKWHSDRRKALEVLDKN